METLAYLHLVLANETEVLEYNPLSPLNRAILVLKPTPAMMQMFCLTLVLLLFGMATQAMALVQFGDRSSEVTFLQQRLQQLGYFEGNITGYFGSLTKQAVMNFQAAKGLSVDGMVGANTQAALESREAPIADSSPKKPTITNTAAATEDPNPILQIGDRGSQVSILQESLAAAGFSGGVNGVFDEATEAAVKQFQQAKGLSVDGIVGKQTRGALPAIGGSTATTTTTTTTATQPMISPPKPEEIMAMQKRLQTRGFYGGSIDGIWGPKTQAAVIAAQKAYSISLDDLPNQGF